jgi:SAM-dependent methyltransferase
MDKKQSTDLLFYWRAEMASFVSAVFSAPFIQSQSIQKITVRPVMLKGKRKLQINSFTATQCITKNTLEENLEETITPILAQFSRGFLSFSHEELHVQLEQDGSLKWKTKKGEKPLLPVLQHNRQKKYILEDGTPIDFLIALGIMNKEGRVLREKYDKFKQINHFLENILPLLTPENRPLHIIDFGCGKAYLTFALYYMLKSRDVHITGVDLKKELLQKCQNLADQLGYKGLTFVAEPIAKFLPTGPVDLVLALHACDTATDEALAKACQLKARAICVAPCCQHEIAAQLQKRAAPVLLSHGLLHERFAAILTDALRAEILKQLGYKTELLEFVDPEHTPKNLLIRAFLTPNPPKPDWTAYKTLADEYGVNPKLKYLLDLNI